MNKIKFQEVIALLVIVTILVHTYIKNIDMADTYKNLLMLILGYYFASSKGSQAKDQIIKDLSNQPTSVTTDTAQIDTAQNVKSENTTINKE